MVSSPYRSALRWALLCALAFGVVGMHHLEQPSGHSVSMASTAHLPGDGTPAAMSSPGPLEQTSAPVAQKSGGPMHSMLHLCLAILLGAISLLVAWFVTTVFLLVRRTPFDDPRRHLIRTRRRRPPDVLSELCVLRL